MCPAVKYGAALKGYMAQILLKIFANFRPLKVFDKKHLIAEFWEYQHQQHCSFVYRFECNVVFVDTEQAPDAVGKVGETQGTQGRQWR